MTCSGPSMLLARHSLVASGWKWCLTARRALCERLSPVLIQLAESYKHLPPH